MVHSIARHGKKTVTCTGGVILLLENRLPPAVNGAALVAAACSAAVLTLQFRFIFLLLWRCRYRRCRGCYSSGPSAMPVAGYCYNSGPSIMPVAPYCAREISRHIWEQPVVALCGVVPVTAVVPMFPAGAYRRNVEGRASTAPLLLLLLLPLRYNARN